MATDHVWPQLVEICQRGGLDYLVVDREHGPHSDELIAQVCQVARLADFPVLMRTVSCETSELRRAPDLGPCGVILPGVETTEQLDGARDALFMPPCGKRRPGGLGNHWLSDLNYETWRDEFKAHFIVIPQIETQRGVGNAASIAAHPLTTSLGLGPYELSADLGCCWQPEYPDHRQAIVSVRAVAADAGKKLWMYSSGKSSDEADTFFWVGEVSGVLQQSFFRLVGQLKDER